MQKPVNRRRKVGGEFVTSAEWEALNLVRFYSTPPIPKDELLNRIRADARVSEPVRERALEFAREWKTE